MKKYTYEDIKNRFDLLGFKWFNFHIVGIRSKQHQPDKFEDTIHLIWGKNVVSYSCTTIPGVHWLQKPINSKGTAILAADRQYIDAYKLGLHKGKPALEQVKPLLVYRDNNKNNLAECIGEPIPAGIDCGINIHGTGPTIVSVLIGAWSAGCQVLNNPIEYKDFLSRCQRSMCSFFTYTLLNEF